MAFVNSVAKPPRDVRRRQEKFGTGGAAVPEKVRIKPAPYTTGSSHVPASNSSSNFHSSPEELTYDGPSTSSAHLAPVASSSVSYDPRKPAVKSKQLWWEQGCGLVGILIQMLIGQRSPAKDRLPLLRCFVLISSW